MRLLASLIPLVATSVAACTPEPEQSEQQELTYEIQPLDANWKPFASLSATHQAIPNGHGIGSRARMAAVDSVHAFCGTASAIESGTVELEIVGKEEASGPNFFSSTPIFAFHCPKTGEETI
ncbi:MAG: hypothetical protein ABJH45_19760 [Paracoccaceae bacterium]